jgi:hypothetical protein
MSKDDISDFIPAPRIAGVSLTRCRVIAHSYPWGFTLAILAFLIPTAQQIFSDCGVPLPWLTVHVFRTSQLVISPPVVAIPALLLAILCGDWLVLKARSDRGEEGQALAWSMLMFALPLLLIAMMVVAIVLPFLTITTQLSG